MLWVLNKGYSRKKCDLGEESNLIKFFGWSFNVFFVLGDAIHLFVCFLALRPKSTAMVIAGRSVHLTTLFPGQA